MFTGRLRRGHMILAAINMLQFAFQLPSSSAGSTLFALRLVAVPFPECAGCGAHRRSCSGCKDHMPHLDDRRVVAVIIVVDKAVEISISSKCLRSSAKLCRENRQGPRCCSLASIPIETLADFLFCSVIVAEHVEDQQWMDRLCENLEFMAKNPGL
jgi:hypothetical protein